MVAEDNTAARGVPEVRVYDLGSRNKRGGEAMSTFYESLQTLQTEHETKRDILFKEYYASLDALEAEYRVQYAAILKRKEAEQAGETPVNTGYTTDF